MLQEPAAPRTHQTDDALAYRTDEALRIVPISRSVLYELRRQGRIRAVKVGRATLWPRVELERLMADFTAVAAGDPAAATTDEPVSSESPSAQPSIGAAS